jgi:hypothetical protein
MDRDSSSYAVSLRVDNRNRTGLRIDRVDLIAHRIRDQFGRVCANLQSPILTKIDQIENSNRVGAAIADVGELAIAIRNVRETVLSTTRDAQQERANNGGNRSWKRKSKGDWHCSESIGLVEERQA